MKHTILLPIALLFCFSHSAAAPLTREECQVMVRDLERMSNLNPQHVEAKAPEALAQLHRGETLTDYFIAYNIYVENLFNKGKVDKAREEIERMLEDASEQDDRECKVIALRT